MKTGSEKRLGHWERLPFLLASGFVATETVRYQKLIFEAPILSSQDSVRDLVQAMSIAHHVCDLLIEYVTQNKL